jgi:glyoxylase-like metal-dependent hydrolase (beta-lactamase superfamily II)
VIPDGRAPLVPNVGIVLGERNALVVDTAMGPRNGMTVRELAEGLAGGRPLLLTITHFHPEHGFGAQAFLPDATIVYNRDQLDEFREKGQPYLEMFRTFGPGVSDQLEGVELVHPRVVYEGEADLDLGGRAVHLRTWGLAHTRGDQVVFLPEERILFAGGVHATIKPVSPVASRAPPVAAYDDWTAFARHRKAELVTAIVLINCRRAAINAVADALADLPAVSEVYSVGGRFDLVAIVRVRENEELATVVTQRFADQPDIERTETLIAFRTISKHDLEGVFTIGFESKS